MTVVAQRTDRLTPTQLDTLEMMLTEADHQLTLHRPRSQAAYEVVVDMWKAFHDLKQGKLIAK
jgi:hypothetical protein